MQLPLLTLRAAYFICTIPYRTVVCAAHLTAGCQTFCLNLLPDKLAMVRAAAHRSPTCESGVEGRRSDAYRKYCEWLRSDTVRLVGADKEMLGVMTLDEALDLADEQELDVIVISPDADPPVCRLVSYDKFKYEEEKAKKVQSKKQREGRCAAREPGQPLVPGRPAYVCNALTVVCSTVSVFTEMF